MVVSTVAFSEGTIYDKPDVQQPGRTIHGKVVNVVKGDAATHQWDVSVQNGETGEVVPFCLDKTTARKEPNTEPAVGDEVVVKYDEQSKHAFCLDATKAKWDPFQGRCGGVPIRARERGVNTVLVRATKRTEMK